jgi:hypothetical protein
MIGMYSVTSEIRGNDAMRMATDSRAASLISLETTNFFALLIPTSMSVLLWPLFAGQEAL